MLRDVRLETQANYPGASAKNDVFAVFAGEASDNIGQLLRLD
ncbi:hypothetical protein GGQ88_003839 [Novosphingobium hassiacum]|uniref:Uncharacterized protein n=1 Tax=Novosphingobium hassiacum TaxID=173676 RepID=A0A7W5ZYT1_9SPHN|nr:hypothetical protein [Novosphingobium hassiacum]MBB3862538.1 hypothetical protein [Novosphingobium hassiacum]